MTVRTYWAWETTATLCLLGGARGTGAPMGGEEHIVSPRAQLVIIKHLVYALSSVYCCRFLQGGPVWRLLPHTVKPVPSTTELPLVQGIYLAVSRIIYIFL